MCNVGNLTDIQNWQGSKIGNARELQIDWQERKSLFSPNKIIHSPEANPKCFFEGVNCWERITIRGIFAVADGKMAEFRKTDG